MPCFLHAGLHLRLPHDDDHTDNLNQEIPTVTYETPPDDQTDAPSATPPRPRKPLTRAFYDVIIRPNTDAWAIADDLWRRLGASDQPMHLREVGFDPDEGDNVLRATIQYTARGANSNDIWRRICSAAGLSKAQVEVTELCTLNLDEDLDRVRAFLPV